MLSTHKDTHNTHAHRCQTLFSWTFFSVFIMLLLTSIVIHFSVHHSCVKWCPSGCWNSISVAALSRISANLQSHSSARVSVGGSSFRRYSNSVNSVWVVTTGLVQEEGATRFHWKRCGCRDSRSSVGQGGTYVPGVLELLQTSWCSCWHKNNSSTKSK